jgi:hypothetical protein
VAIGPVQKRGRFDSRRPGPATAIYVDRGPFPPNTRPEDYQLPVGESETIILGLVTKGQPYLSEDGTNLYTEYTISIEEVFKDSARLSLKRGGVIALNRMGWIAAAGLGQRRSNRCPWPWRSTAHRTSLHVLS